MQEELKAGASNCVIDCARVKEGDQVYILNQEGAVEDEVSNVIREVAEKQGAKAKVVWGKAIPKGTDEVPEILLDAYRLGDVVISHYPSLRRESLYAHVQGDRRPRATNRATNRELLQSEWARFPYSLQLAIIKNIDDILASGKKWRITSPKGTDVRGEMGASDSAVAQAYFLKGEDNTRASRNFPGGVHTPLMSVRAEGVIVVDHASISGFISTAEPVRIELKDGRVTSISGGDEAGKIREELAKTDGFLDSWHAGTNPKTILPHNRKVDPRAWWVYAHCSPMVLHFHLGRSHAPVNVATFNQTLYVDGRKIYEEGRLAILEDTKVEAAAKRFGDPDKLLQHNVIDLS